MRFVGRRPSGAFSSGPAAMMMSGPPLMHLRIRLALMPWLTATLETGRGLYGIHPALGAMPT